MVPIESERYYKTLKVSVMRSPPHAGKSGVVRVSQRQPAAVGGHHHRLNRHGLLRCSRSQLTEVQIRMSKMLQNRAAVPLSMVLVVSLSLPAATTAKPLPAYRYRTAQAAEEAFPKQGKVQKLSRYIKDKYDVPVQKASNIVSEALRNGTQHGLDPELILAVIAVESTFREKAVSSRGARGLMQVKANSHQGKVKSIGGAHALFSADKNIHTGSKILADYLDDHNGNLRRALLSYSGSQKNPKSSYPDKVLHVYRNLKQVHR
jgi:soluble lytic murein transglycosylase-like protein